MKLMLRVNEATEATGISRSTLYRMMKSGDIESLKVGGRRLIPVDALKRAIAGMRSAEGAEFEEAAE